SNDPACRSGSLYVYHLSDEGTPSDPTDDRWIRQPKITASDAAYSDNFGSVLAMDGDRFVVGVSGGDDACVNDWRCDSGAVYVFRRDDGGTPGDISDDVWIEEAKLTASDAAREDWFGRSVSINGDRIVVGTPRNGDGAMYIFRLQDGGTPLDPSDDTWREERKVRASDPVFAASLGQSVSVLGNWAVAGADTAETAGIRSGAVYVYLVEGDCNGNGILDDTDIADGTSRDCNANDLPDECEIDCQPNCIPDSCDLASGSSPDADTDGIPDECATLTDYWFSIDVTPPMPFGAQPVNVTVTARLPEACYETCEVTGEWISADEFHVDFGVRELREPGGACLQIIRTLRAEFPLGTLAPGHYRVTATEFITPKDPPCSDRTFMAAAVIPFRVMTDCNGNGASDTCDVIGGASLDCNADDIPDECQTDCNANGVPDDCDLATGSSPDCNANGVADECDVSSGTSPDCNANGVPDVCDLASGTSPDCDGNGVPDVCDVDCDANGVADACECVVVNAPALRTTYVPKNRYLSVMPDPLGLGCRTALRVTFAELPPPFDTLNGQSMWVGPLQSVNEEGGVIIPAPNPPVFMAAPLQCNRFVSDWNAADTVHVYHRAIVPGGTYTVQAVGEGCSPQSEADFSAPLSMTQGVWGDMVGRFDPVNRVWMAPDGIIEIISDCLAIMDKFADHPNAPIKTRADIEPATPDQLINISDVVRCLDAFRGRSYPFDPGPPPCP
ncbi:MAG: FG-GAP repeat protein, partial [Phycisphaerae bacterium]